MADEREERCKRFIYESLLKGPVHYEELLATYVLENKSRLYDKGEREREIESFRDALFEMQSERRIAVHLKVSLTS
jgi:hypothetical protein